MCASSPTIWTVGHSNRSIEDFLAHLRGAGIEQIADVRRFPGSRKWPQFGRDALPRTLAEAGIGYEHFPALGGRRGKPAADSPNRGWRVAQFAAYADYMDSHEFREGLAALMAAASERRTAMMCSEAVPWRCHRRLVADALLVQGWEVGDIMSPTKVTPHALTEFAEVREGVLTYPAQA